MITSDDLNLLQRNEQLTKYGLTIDNLWKLIINGKNHDKGSMVYDNSGESAEPGYLKSMENAFLYMFKTANDPLSVTLITKYNNIASKSSLDKIPPRIKGRELKYEMDDLQELINYGFTDTSTYNDNKQLVFLSDYSKSTELPKFLNWINNRNYVEMTYRIGMGSQYHSEELLKSIIEEYNKKILLAKTDDQKLYVIARFAKQVNVIHHFNDGNMRTTVLLINKLLIQNNLPLTIMSDPANIGFKSSKWIVDNQIKPGQVSYLEEIKSHTLGSQKLKSNNASPEVNTKPVNNNFIINNPHLNNNNKLNVKNLRTAVPGLQNLYSKITIMRDYGISLQKGKEAKGLEVIDHANSLEKNADAFFTQSPNKQPTNTDIEKFVTAFTILLHKKDAEMKAHRQIWKPIIANILIALTGIGLLAIAIKAGANLFESFTKNTPFNFKNSFFFTKTKTEQKFEDIKEAVIALKSN